MPSVRVLILKLYQDALLSLEITVSSKCTKVGTYNLYKFLNLVVKFNEISNIFHDTVVIIVEPGDYFFLFFNLQYAY